MFVPRRKHITSPLLAQQVNAIYRLVTMVTITILDIIRRPAFNIKHTLDNVRTSQETHYISATHPTG
jgi:hypothetical protein